MCASAAYAKGTVGCGFFGARERQTNTMVRGGGIHVTWKRGMTWKAGTRTPGKGRGRAGKTRATFARDLHLGDRGVEVCRLQADVLGMEPSGHFDLETQQKLKTWQSRNQVEPTGCFGPLSRLLVEEQLQILVEQAKKVAEDGAVSREEVEEAGHVSTTDITTTTTDTTDTTTTTKTTSATTGESIGESLRPPSPPGGEHGLPIIMGILASAVLAALSNRETWTVKRTSVFTQNWNTDVGRQLRKLVARPSKKYFFLKDGKMLPGRVLVETTDQLPSATAAEGGGRKRKVVMKAETLAFAQQVSAKQELRAWEEQQMLSTDITGSGISWEEEATHDYVGNRSETYNLRDRMERTRSRRQAKSWQLHEGGMISGQMEDDSRQKWRQSSPEHPRKQFSR